MRVSPLYFRWLLNMIRKYGKNRNCRDAGLLGISLSPVKVEEMHKPFSEWHAPDVVKGSVYLSLVPSSWGSAYWSDRWSEFAEFVELRMQAPFYNITVEAMEKAGDVFLPHACPCVYWRCQLLKHSVSMLLLGREQLVPIITNRSFQDLRWHASVTRGVAHSWGTM